MADFGGGDLDPTDWDQVRSLGHRMLDDMFNHVQGLRAEAVWREPPAALRQGFREGLPARGANFAEVYGRFRREILPYSSGNAHPAFMGWVQGGGTIVGMLAEMLAAGMNSNLGGRDHMPLEVEQQVVAWAREIFGFPAEATGLFLTGTSQANFLGLLIARRRALGEAVRTDGLDLASGQLTAYASTAAHGCVAAALDMAGIGSAQLRQVAVDLDGRIRLDEVERAIAADRRAGRRPFAVIGSAGTVDTGAIDDLDGLAAVAAREGLYFHVDGAFGALAMLAPSLAGRLAGIEKADSIAFDWHKWAQVPYDAGFILVRDPALHRATFAADANYLRRDQRGLAAGDWWPCDYGPDLSRSFRALKVWFTLKTYGAQALGAGIARSCDLAAALGRRIEAEPNLELLAPIQLNIVCFRHRGDDADGLNTEIVARLHESGVAAPSLTRIAGYTAIRAALFNHRTTAVETDALVRHVLDLGRAIAAERGR